MLEKSAVEFLEQVTVERKQLSEEEKKEAMKAASKVWAKAMEKADGKDYSSFSHETPTTLQRISLWIGKNISFHKPENPNTDLVIVVEEDVRIGEDKWARSDIINTYYFALGTVSKKVLNVRDISINTNEDLSIGDRVRRDIAQVNVHFLEFDRQTEEVYHPDKADLRSLIQSLSSAK